MTDQIKAYMNSITNKIRDAEFDMQLVWFDVEHGEISWAIYEPQGSRRIMLGDRPLSDHRFIERERLWRDAVALRAIALEQAESRMEGLGNE